MISRFEGATLVSTCAVTDKNIVQLIKKVSIKIIVNQSISSDYPRVLPKKIHDQIKNLAEKLDAGTLRTKFLAVST